MGVIIYNGKRTDDYGIEVEAYPDYVMAEKDFESIHIPGKNGDLILETGSYKNVERTYVVSIAKLQTSFEDMAGKLSEWLNSGTNYCRLEDDYEPDYFRMAFHHASTDVINVFGKLGKASIPFTCKPQRFFKTGEIAKQFLVPGTIVNPSVQPSLPLIVVYGNGSGTVRIDDYTITISNIATSITIDSELQDAYNGTINRNNDISVDPDFPKLMPGSNSVSFVGGITKVEVIPRWWTL